MRNIRLIFSLFLGLTLTWTQAQNHDHDHGSHGHDHGEHHDHDHHGEGHCSFHLSHEFDPAETAFHHIADQNIFSIGPFGIPLPCILKAKGGPLDIFSSSVFDYDAHGMGHKAHKGYVLYAGAVMRVNDSSFPTDNISVDGYSHDAEGKPTVCLNGSNYPLEAKSTADGGLFGGGMTSFYDLSISKNVVTMIVVLLLMMWLFIGIARKYAANPDKAPSGIQGLMEPIILFLRDEVAIPFIGDKHVKYMPFLLSLFFFILGLNLIGQIPFFGGSNVTGNLGVTIVLAVFAFLVTTFAGNKHYWQHIFNMPGVPAPVKLILTPVEFLGLFIKPITLALRLFANITAGHMVIVIFVGFIFLFGKSGEVPAAAWGVSIPTTLLTLFMMAIELLVAFIQAFVFTLLTASYIGAAVEDAHHDEAH